MVKYEILFGQRRDWRSKKYTDTDMVRVKTIDTSPIPGLYIEVTLAFEELWKEGVLAHMKKEVKALKPVHWVRGLNAKDVFLDILKQYASEGYNVKTLEANIDYITRDYQ